MGRLVPFPILLRRHANASAVGTAAVVRASEGGCAGPGRFDHFSNGESAALDGVFERTDVVGGASWGNRVLPDEVLVGDVGAEVTGFGAHVAVKKFEPSFLERIGKHVGVLVEVLGDFSVLRVSNHGHVGGRHHGGDLDGRIFCVGSHVRFVLIGWVPLMGACRALSKGPGVFVLEEHVKVAVVPNGGVGRPCAFDTAGDGVSANAGAKVACPAEALLFKRSAFGLGTFVVLGSSAVSLAEGVSPGRQSDGFFIVHGHALERLTDVLCAEKRVGVGVGALRVDVDEAHLHGGEWVLEVLAGLTVAVVAQPFVFAAPVDVVFGVPNVGSATAESKNGPAHGFDSDLPGQNEQICPTDGVAVLLLDWPEKSAGFVEVAVVGPAVEGCKSLCAGSATASAVAGSVRSCSVPGHANEERTVMAVIRWPPVLAVGHQCVKIGFEGLVVKGLERFSVVEVLAHWIGLFVVLMKDVQIEVFWPPILVRAHVGSG